MTDQTSTPNDTDNRCYRHPNRETFVKCQRCGRPICGQCQTIAPVGVHCPECVREARGSGASSVRPIGRRIANASRSGSGVPVVTFTIIGLNVVVFILELLTGNPIMGNGTGTVADALAYFPGAIVVAPWTIITNGFVHANLIHIGVNMYSLFALGPPLERFLGRGRYLALYVIGMIGADVGVDFLSRAGAIGASGAIFALLGALILFARRLGFSTTWLIVIGVINLGYGFLVPDVSWQGHLGGLIVGLLIGVLFLVTRSRQRRPLQIAALVVLPVILLVVLLLHATV
jgi:membrane associated rhomboid family serine protease